MASIGRGSSGSSSSNDNVPHVLTTSLAEGSSEDPSKESNASVSIISRSRALYAIPETTVRAWVRATDMADRVVRKVGEGETRERVNADVAQDIDDGEVYDLKHLSSWAIYSRCIFSRIGRERFPACFAGSIPKTQHTVQEASTARRH